MFMCNSTQLIIGTSRYTTSVALKIDVVVRVPIPKKAV